MPQRPRPRTALIAALGALALAAPAHADPPATILHEFLPPDPNEDVAFATTTLEGNLPSAIRTPSGIATAPDPQRPPSADHVYGGATTDDSPDSSYEPDRDTRRPNVENYDDPFSPATAPFKRLRAYDWVSDDYSLHVRDKTLSTVPVGGVVNAGDEAFYGDLSIDLLPDQPVRIPTVGPGSRLLRMHLNPDLPVDVLRDPADNWFLRARSAARARLVVELAIPRATFGSDFADVNWSALGNAPRPNVPPPEALAEVTRAVGISRTMRPREVVRKMVTYFRAFEPSEVPPNSHQDIYLDLALSQKGVCRHRAFAFFVTALGIGIPSRMVVNEAHAWIESFDGSLWHRIDLGGAAANLEHRPDPGRPPYKPPPDPYEWPTSHDSGDDLADRNRSQQGLNSGGPSANGSSSSAPSPSPTNTPTATPANPSPNTPSLPESEIKVTAIDRDARRGYPLRIQGQISSAGAACSHLRVDVLLTSPTRAYGTVVGSLSTDPQGKFDGAVVIPREVTLGEYDLVIATPGDSRCGPGSTK